MDEDGERVSVKPPASNASIGLDGDATGVGVIYMADNDQQIAVHVGYITAPAQAEAINKLLGGVLTLPPDDRETVHRVVDALLAASPSAHTGPGADGSEPKA